MDAELLPSRYVQEMFGLDRRRVLDLLLSAAILSWWLVETWTEDLRPQWVSVASAVLGSAALLWRRGYPLGVAGLFLSVQVLEAAAGVSMHSAVAPIAAFFVVAWSVGAHETRRRAIGGLVFLLCGLWASMAIDAARGTDHYVGSDYPWIGALIAMPWLVGLAFGSRTESLREAETRADRLERERLVAVAEERARIARELHDVVAHAVSVMTVQAGAAEEMLRIDPARAVDPVRSVQETGRQALVEMKRLVGMLREGDEEVGLAPQPGLAALQELVSQVRGAGLDVELRVEGAPRPLPLGVDLSSYRIVQEALTNAVKHANARRATVTVHYGAGELAIEVSDDGDGPSGNGSSGHGLVGMRERVAVFGGAFAAGPGERGGFRVQARLPVEAPR
jgi:signal transduction histidine kinase